MSCSAFDSVPHEQLINNVANKHSPTGLDTQLYSYLSECKQVNCGQWTRCVFLEKEQELQISLLALAPLRNWSYCFCVMLAIYCVLGMHILCVSTKFILMSHQV